MVLEFVHLQLTNLQDKNMTPDKIIASTAGIIILVIIVGVFFMVKGVLENIDNVDEDDDGFFDRRDRV